VKIATWPPSSAPMLAGTMNVAKRTAVLKASTRSAAVRLMSTPSSCRVTHTSSALPSQPRKWKKMESASRTGWVR